MEKSLLKAKSAKAVIFHVEFANVQIVDIESLSEETDSSYFWKYKFLSATILVVDDY